jgi:ribosomal protein S18 acetylase RimI-like enzyme
MHLNIYKESHLNGKLIYFDDNFKFYLKGILNKKSTFIYGVINNDKLLGFVHFKEIGDSTLFLNNIFIDKSIRGKGLGTYILNKLLHLNEITEQNYTYFELDVFKSNYAAHKWYKKLGLIEIEYSYWFSLIKLSNISKNQVDFDIRLDTNNFNSLYFKNEKVATIIKGNYIIVHNEIAYMYNTELPYIRKQNNKITPENFMVSELDVSIRMKGDLKTISNNITC